ncbi:MAG: lipopolysaccharide biosynthesis protein [Flavobacteriaceae bacterium]|nr:lipopolysaccharide biosynthesis protein [Flavobacteriaceae bacterium]
MGIVINQSIKNTIITYFGFGIGAINALFLYTIFLGKLHYGIVVFVISAANIMMPLMSFGVQNTLIRFYSKYNSESERDNFLSLMLYFPLIVILPTTIFLYFFYPQITYFILDENPNVTPFLWLIPLVGIFMGYFEIFYAWVKVHFQSVFGNFLSEVGTRVIVLFLLISVSQNWIQKDTFVYSISAVYAFQCLVMMVYAMHVKRAVFKFQLPNNSKEIFSYSIFIIASGTVTVMLIDFDKVIIPAYQNISNNAFYSVAVFIAMVISVPSRAMMQIIYPVTAQLLNENKLEELNLMYKKSAINLQVFGGLIMLGIFLNCKELYQLIPQEYSGGIAVVFLIGLSKFYDMIIGNNTAIILNSKYYRWFLFFGIVLVALMIGLYMILIPIYGIVGAALATLIAVFFYNTTKVLFVFWKMNLFPFTIKTVYSFGILTLVFLMFYFWDFAFYPIINIFFKSLLITIVYGLLNYKLKISVEINELFDKFISKVKF